MERNPSLFRDKNCDEMLSRLKCQQTSIPLLHTIGAMEKKSRKSWRQQIDYGFHDEINFHRQQCVDQIFNRNLALKMAT